VYYIFFTFYILHHYCFFKFATALNQYLGNKFMIF